MQQPFAYIPSPSQNAVHLGPIPLRGYALMIIIGVIVAVWLSERRWTARGGAAGTVLDVAVWAVPFGLVGGRLYHVITDHQLYFGHGRHPIDALKVWHGGLGIWGAIALGAVGAYLGARRRGISMRAFADAAAPGVVLAQAIGRWGNWFNQELFGRPSNLPWAVKIDPAHRAFLGPKYADISTYQPTFLYESLWCIGVAVLVIWAEKRFRLAYGRTFALYVAAYTVGRAWIEWLRIDEAHHILGLRLNDWTSLIVFLAAAGYLYAYRSRTENPPGAFGTEAAETGAAETEGVTAEAAAVGAAAGAGAVEKDGGAPVPAAGAADDDTRADETEASATGESHDGSGEGQGSPGTPEAAAGAHPVGAETTDSDTGESGSAGSGTAGSESETSGSDIGESGSAGSGTEDGGAGEGDTAETDREPADGAAAAAGAATAGTEAAAARNGVAGTATASGEAAPNGAAGTAEADATADEEPSAPVGTGAERSADAGRVGKDS